MTAQYDGKVVPAAQLVCETCGMAEDEPCPTGGPRPHSQHSTIACLEYHPFKAAVPAPAAPSPIGSVAEARATVFALMQSASKADPVFDGMMLDALIEAVRNEKSAAGGSS